MNEENVIRIEDIVDTLKKRWRMIVAITTIAVIFSGIMSFLINSPKYEVTTKLFIGKENSNDVKASDSDILMYQKLLKKYAEIISTNNLVEKAIDKDGLNITSGEVLGGLTVTPRTDTQILEINYTSDDKFLAKDIIDSITNEFIQSSTELIPNGDVKIIESAKIPGQPVGPNKKKNIAIAFLLGLMISVGLSFLIEFMDNTLKTKAQLERLLELPVIGAIPNELE